MMEFIRRYWTGVGSRNTPPDILLMMQLIGKVLTDLGYILRSGGAEGADTAFYAGCKLSDKFYEFTPEVFLSWDGMEAYGKKWHHDPKEGFYDAHRYKTWQSANQIALLTRGSWERCGWGGQQHHTRNVFQVIGHSLTAPSDFLICWAPPVGKKTPWVRGGTVTAVKLAVQRKIEVFNLYHPEVFNRFVDFLDKHDEPHSFHKKAV